MKPFIQTTILMTLFSSVALAQTKADPYKPTDLTEAASNKAIDLTEVDPHKPIKSTIATPSPMVIGTAASDEDSPINLSTCLEVFSMPMSMAAAMQRENISDEECYKRLAGQPADSPVKQEVLMVLRSRNGEKATNESVIEEFYASEYGKPVAPTNLTLGSFSAGNETKPVESIKGFYPAPTPQAIETRNTGETVEIEVIVTDESYRHCSVRMVPQQVLLTGYSNLDVENKSCAMPIFETRRLSSGFDVTVGKPFLIGTLSRPTHSKIDPNAANTVSFAFITIKLSR